VAEFHKVGQSNTFKQLYYHLHEEDH